MKKTLIAALRASAIIPLLALGYSCSSGMSKEECQLADWRQIGFEDGSLGRSANYLANRRKACSKAQVTPDFDAYQRGHAEGLKRWCNYDNGLRFGQSGGAYQGICPKNQESAFLQGYDYGKKLYHATQKVNALRSEIDDVVNTIADLRAENESLNNYIISKETSEVERLKAITRKDEIPKEINSLEAQVMDLENMLHRATKELDNIRS